MSEEAKTVKAKCKVSRAGDGFSQVPGDIIDVDVNEVKSLLKAGHIELIKEEDAKKK